jgi:hypothetical protein
MTDAFPRSMTVKQAVISTLAYFHLFGVPLTRDEISDYLFFQKPDEKKIDMYLKESPYIHYHKGYFSLKGDADFYNEFFNKLKRSKEYWKRVNRYRFIFSLCPFIEFIGVCNSLPIRSTGANSDIDLFIVTKKGKLHTARFFLTLFTSLFGVRRHGDKIRKRFCLSFYMTDENLSLRKIAQAPYDIYLAYWLKTLEPVAGTYSSYKTFINVNCTWLKPYFHKINLHTRRYRRRKPWHKKVKSRLELWFGSKKWENRFKTKQLERIHKKQSAIEDQSGTIISENMLKFHNKDQRSDIRKNWEKVIQNFI